MTDFFASFSFAGLRPAALALLFVAASALSGCGTMGKAEHYALRSRPIEPAFYTPEIGKAGGLDKAREKGVIETEEKDESLIADWLF